ncbi:sulfite exporter TauE/SafE family protein [Natrinema salinisoli]|uniref:sulfite exporter TauE/SafE family protein n=1 Tax=Natrinema salinisoli TaxID=2878535 RepID=UPI001CF00149|nr:sulfite exporter TauE/SafE family protein [Natrinema salinisoli]
MELLGLSLVSIAVFVGFGLLVGVLFGFFGMGGSFLVTPALLVLGYPTTVAVGSGLGFVFGTSVVGALSHRTHGQIDYKLVASLTVAMTAGIEVGKRAVVVLDGFGSADLVIAVAYIGLLALVGLFTLHDARHEDDGYLGADLTDRVQTLDCPPMVSVTGDVRVSVWVILAIGGVVGTLSGFLGVGGGFLLLPAMMYGLGVPAGIAVGTDILQITVSGAFGTFVYARTGAVSLPVVGSLLVGSAFGARIGAVASALVHEDEIREYFAAVLLAGSLAVTLKTLSALLGVAALHTASIVLIFGAAIAVSATVVLAATGRVRASAP